MKYNTEIIYNIKDNIWNDNLKSSISSTTYQLPEWLLIYKKSFNSIPVFIIVRDKNTIVGQLACIIHNDYFWRDSNFISKSIGKKFNLRTVLNWSYGPIIHDKSNQNLILSEILVAIDEIISTNNVTLVHGSSSPFSKFDLNIFKNFGYSEKKWSTYVLDLTQFDSNLLSNFDKKIRYDIRQAENMNLKFEIVNDNKELNEFAKFAVTTKNLSGESRKWNPKFFENLWYFAYKPGFHKVFLVRDENEILGAIDTLIFNGNVVQAGVVNSPKRKFNAGTFLTFKTIEWMIQQNQKFFDFGGANPNPINEKEKQIDFYKSKWNGMKKEYSFYTKIISKSKLKLSSFIKSPTSITKIIPH